MSESKLEGVGEGSCESGNENAGAAAPELPPITNRGVTMTIDYLSITVFINFSRVAFLVIEHLLEDIVLDEIGWESYFFNRNISGRGYKTLYQGPEGMTLYAYPSEGMHCHLEMKGKALAAFDNERLLAFIDALNNTGLRWQPTRIDIAFDHVSFTPAMCKKAYDEGCFRTRANRDSGSWYEGSKGNTFYMGAKTSNRRVRIYDKRGFTRVELVLKKEYAKFLKDWLTDWEKIIELSLGLLRSFIVFTNEPVYGKNSSRIELASWWASLVSNVEKVSIEKKIKFEDFLRNRTKAYFERMLPTLCVFFYGLGIDLNEEVQRFYAKLEPKHIAKILKLNLDR